MISKYARLFALALALFVAAPIAFAASPAELGAGQNANKAYNGGGAPVRRKSKPKSKSKSKRKVRKTGHSGH